MLAVAHAVPGWLKAVLDALGRFADTLVALGPLGAFVLTLVDSYVPLPGGPDLAVVVLSANTPALAPIVVLAATAGACVGATTVYLVARRAGEAALRRVSPDRRERIENLLGRYDVLAIVGAAVCPPPFPFKAFNICAGVFRVKVPRFVLAIFVGRGVRFGAEAVLAVLYGRQALDMLRANAAPAFLILLVAGAAVVLWRWLASRREADSELPVAPEE